jgi:hypothetical protein
MKQVALLLLTSFACLGRPAAQSAGGILDQQATELKYYEQQIAYLELYTGWLEKGYKIARQGLTAIAGIKKGEFDLHQAFFNSLSSVNPQIAAYSRIVAIIAMQASIISNFRYTLKQTGHFSASEISYLQSVYSNLSGACSQSLAGLADIITDGTMTMKDDERIEWIDHIYRDIKDKYAFTQSFTGEAALLAAERANEQNQIDLLNRMN